MSTKRLIRERFLLFQNISSQTAECGFSLPEIAHLVADRRASARSIAELYATTRRGRSSAGTSATQGQIHMLSKQIRLVLSQTLLFVRQLDAMQEQTSRVLGADAVALLAQAWLRRTMRGLTSTHLLQCIDPAWRAVASDVLAAGIKLFIAPFRLACFLCSLCDIITGLLLAASLRVFPLYNDTGSTSSDIPWLAALGSSALAT
jgi:hypothetical protein